MRVQLGLPPKGRFFFLLREYPLKSSCSPGPGGRLRAKVAQVEEDAAQQLGAQPMQLEPVPPPEPLDAQAYWAEHEAMLAVAAAAFARQHAGDELGSGLIEPALLAPEDSSEGDVPAGRRAGPRGTGTRRVTVIDEDEEEGLGAMLAVGQARTIEAMPLAAAEPVKAAEREGQIPASDDEGEGGRSGMSSPPRVPSACADEGALDGGPKRHASTPGTLTAQTQGCEAEAAAAGTNTSASADRQAGEGFISLANWIPHPDPFPHVQGYCPAGGGRGGARAYQAGAA